MNRISTAASLSLSVVAVVLAALAFLDSRSNSAASDSGSTVVGDDSNETIAKLERDLADLTVKYNDLVSKDTEKKASAKKWAAKKASKTGAKSEGIASGGGEKLEETVALLRERVNTLESAENIHQLAQSGKKQATTKELHGSLATLRDSDADPEDRVAALRTLRGMRKPHHEEFAAMLEEQELGEADLGWPMIEIARDPNLEPELRGEALRNLRGMETKEFREPLLEIFNSQDASEVRTGAFDALAWQMGDTTVRNTLREAANDTQYPDVQARATRLMPKIEWLDRRDQERAATSASGTATATDSAVRKE